MQRGGFLPAVLFPKMIGHIFIRCPFVKKIWHIVLIGETNSRGIPGSSEALLDDTHTQLRGGRNKHKECLLVGA